MGRRKRLLLAALFAGAIAVAGALLHSKCHDIATLQAQEQKVKSNIGRLDSQIKVLKKNSLSEKFLAKVKIMKTKNEEAQQELKKIADQRQEEEKEQKIIKKAQDSLERFESVLVDDLEPMIEDILDGFQQYVDEAKEVEEKMKQLEQKAPAQRVAWVNGASLRLGQMRGYLFDLKDTIAMQRAELWHLQDGLKKMVAEVEGLKDKGLQGFLGHMGNLIAESGRIGDELQTASESSEELSERLGVFQEQLYEIYQRNK